METLATAECLRSQWTTFRGLSSAIWIYLGLLHLHCRKGGRANNTIDELFVRIADYDVILSFRFLEFALQLRKIKNNENWF